MARKWLKQGSRYKGVGWLLGRRGVGFWVEHDANVIATLHAHGHGKMFFATERKRCSYRCGCAMTPILSRIAGCPHASPPCPLIVRVVRLDILNQPDHSEHTSDSQKHTKSHPKCLKERDYRPKSARRGPDPLLQRWRRARDFARG